MMNKQQNQLHIKDQAVTGEEFTLIYDPLSDSYATNPKPTPEEMPKYYNSENYISHTDGRRNIFERAYQYVKRFNNNRKLKLIESLGGPSGKLLDVGCGTGDFLLAAKRRGWKVTGIEPNAEARDKAREKIGNVAYDIDQQNDMPEENFDVITLWHVLEHFYEPKLELERLEKLLDPNGRLFVAVPNFKSFDAGYYKKYWAAYDVPRHLWHFSKKGINKLAKEAGFEIEKISPMKFDAYYVSLLSEKYKNGWMNIFNAFFVASRSNLKAARTGEHSSLIYVLKKL